MGPVWLDSFVHHWGLMGLALDILLEAMGVPVPGETLLVLVAGMSAQGTFNPVAVALVAFVAAAVGDNIGYFVGRKFGRPVVLKYGGRFGITPERLDWVENKLQHRGVWVVIVARFVALLRQLNGLAAGTAGMHWARFLVANAIGAALWASAWTILGYRFGVQVTHIPGLWHLLARTAAFVVPAVVIFYIVGWWIIRRRRRR